MKAIVYHLSFLDDESDNPPCEEAVYDEKLEAFVLDFSTLEDLEAFIKKYKSVLVDQDIWGHEGIDFSITIFKEQADDTEFKLEVAKNNGLTWKYKEMENNNATIG